ncbi:MAG: hypothetical protein QME16_00085 [Planctomycetota bacterium]|nr:hypothetical protein [Planctomycetota bacterium]
MPPIAIPIAIAATAATAGASAIASSQKKKAAKRAEDLVKEQQQTAIAEQRRLEEKFGLTPGELAREQRLYGLPEGEQPIKISEGLEAKQQKELERRAGLLGEELLREVGPQTRQLLDKIAARQGKTGEELFREEGPSAIAFADQILGEAKTPGGTFEDTLPQQLELARQMVNAEANRRGVFGGTPEGGIRFEQLGRAGVDLAIKSAAERQAARQQSLSNAFQTIQAYQALSSGARGEAGTVGERALTEKERSRAELSDFLQLMENASASSKGRSASVATQAAGIYQPSISEGYRSRMGIEGFKGGIISPAEAGLSAIGQIGADYLGDLPTTAPKTPPGGSAPTDLSGLRKAGAEYDVFDELGGISGSSVTNLKKKYPALLGDRVKYF